MVCFNILERFGAKRLIEGKEIRTFKLNRGLFRGLFNSVLITVANLIEKTSLTQIHVP